MPVKKQPKSLECQSLLCVPRLVREVCRSVSEETSQKYYKQKHSDSAVIEVNGIIARFRDLLFTSTAHYFHKDISRLVIAAISELICDEALQMGNRESFLLTKSHLERRKLKQKEQLILEFSALLCDPSVHHLSLPCDLELSLVQALCAAVPHMTGLHCLDLGTWQCHKHSLLSSSGMEDGSGLMHLQNLAMLSVTNVSLDFIINISVFCPNLTSLTLNKSEVNFEATCYVSNLKRLKKLNLKEPRNMSSSGYAELLRNLPELCFLGRCDSFGEVIAMLYDKWSLYKRSIRTIPNLLPLEEVACAGSISEYELNLISRHCPNIRKLSLEYKPMFSRDTNSDSDLPELALLSNLSHLDQLCITFADFYSHSLLTAVKTVGGRLTCLELNNVDELNLASLIVIGEYCKLLRQLVICSCHYTPELSDRANLEQACTEKERSKADRPFSKLRRASFNLTTSYHIPILKYPIFFAIDLEELRLNQIYQPLEDSFISSLISWNPLQSMMVFHLSNGTHLTLLSVNTIIESCPRLKHIGQLETWGGVQTEELLTFKRQIASTNIDLFIE